MLYPLINGAVINGEGGNGAPTTQGFMHTRYGKPEFILVPGEDAILSIPSLGRVTNLGTPSYGLAPTVVAPVSMARTTRFGTPTWQQGAVLPGLSSVVVTSLGRVTRFGTPSVLPERTVVAGSIAPSAVFGTPHAVAVVRAQGLLSTQYGTPSFGAALRVQGFRSTAYGTPRVSTVVRAPSLPGTRYGHPNLKGFTYAGTLGFSGTEYGTPSIHRAVHVLSAAPGLRCGRPTIVRNAQC